MSAVQPVGLIKSCNGNERQRRTWVLIEGLAPPSRLGVFNNTVANGYRAFAERYFTCKVGDGFEPALKTGDRQWLSNPLMREFCEKLHDNMCLAPTISLHDVVELYKGTKYKVYMQAEQRYWRDGLTQMDAALKSFVKFEKCDLTKAPRVINPRDTKYNLALGKFLKVNEKNYFKAIAKIYGQEHVVIKGMDALKCGEAIGQCWDETEDPIAIGGDASKFDMHVSRSALKFEHVCYLRNYCSTYEEATVTRWWGELNFKRGVKFSEQWPDRDQLAWLLAGQLDNRGTAYFKDGKLKFKMSGTRASGDLNTSLGNCIIMCALTYCWQKKSGVRCRLANNGDDCVYFIRAQDEMKWRDGFDEYYRSCGFRMVLEDTVDELNKVEFCQCHPIHTYEGLKMVRNPKTLVEKGAMCLMPALTINSLRKWMMAVGIAEGSLGRGVPVIQNFATAMRRNGVRCTSKYMSTAFRQSGRIYQADFDYRTEPITDQARVDFYNAWGITPDYQIALEKYYDSYEMTREFGKPIMAHEAVDRDTVQYAAEMRLLV